MTKPETEKLIEIALAASRSVDVRRTGALTEASDKQRVRAIVAALSPYLIRAQGGGATPDVAPDAVEWSPSNAFEMRVGSYCPVCPGYLEPRARLIDKRGLLHCERCNSGSYGFVQAACGGCGETREENRCVGCLHQFAHARSAGGEGNG